MYKGAELILPNGSPFTELRVGTSTSSKVMDETTGEFNASSIKDLCGQITRVMNAIENGHIAPASQHMKSMSSAAVVQKRREALQAAYHDTSGEAWKSLGGALALQLQEQRAREGFMRRVCAGQTLKSGDLARIEMPCWDAVAIVASSSAQVGYQVIRNKTFNLVEFEVLANLRAEQLEIDQASGDLLETLYTQGLDATMVTEDRLWKQAADLSVNVVNPITYVSGSLTPGLLMKAQTQVTNWNLPATTAIISNDFWTDVSSSADFAAFFDPVTKYDLVMNGTLATLSGMTLITDAFRQPNQKVLEQGEIYIISSPENHAGFTDRGGIRATPTSGADQGNTTRGWLLVEALSFVLANPRSVAKAKRI
jgi:hypothetical protein